jgi:uncharacterized protein YebE (UPF0316 family)
MQESMIEEIMNNTYWATLIIFLAQLVFVYLITLNVIYITERNILGAIVTGNGIGICRLLVWSIGINSVMQGNILPIVSYLVGGSIGVYIGIKQKQKREL